MVGPLGSEVILEREFELGLVILNVAAIDLDDAGAVQPNLQAWRRSAPTSVAM